MTGTERQTGTQRQTGTEGRTGARPQRSTQRAGTDGATPRERVLTAPPPAPGRGFADTWWGRGWLKALEESALDGARLRQGRRAARAGAVGAVSVRPGRLTAVVRSAEGTAWRADVLLRRLTEAEWDRLLGTVAREAGHLAALLDGEMPRHLVADAAAAGIDLLPGIGDLEPRCECGEWDHCAHTAALCYQVARLLDADPFLLLLLRGREEADLTEEWQRRGQRRAEEEREPERARAGMPAGEAYARATRLPQLPAPPPVPGAPTIPALAGGVPPAPGLDVGALEFLIADAARRARRMLAEALRPGHAATPLPEPLDEGQDAVRMAAGGAPAPVAERLAAAGGRGRVGLELAVCAWESGGPAALAALEGPPRPVPGAAERLAAAWEGEERPVLRGGGDRWTVVGEGLQLRVDAAGRWWPFRRRGGRWWPAGGAQPEPAAALAAARGGEGDGRAGHGPEGDGREGEEPGQASPSSTG
ncbi:SWF or SNF family helicase [Streptomyces hoynatensis]|uniref:SWIM zinc finger family protein n=1 Tax=Streptomyces hoynatensis TaxID=1141874 RepID=UPI00187E6E9F|nr:SWF or SNF family helicase [Streptomyces hoynatensis]